MNEEKRKRAPGGGRKSIHGEPMHSITFRGTELHDQKLTALGGAAWIRAQIEAAPWPRGTKPKA